MVSYLGVVKSEAPEANDFVIDVVPVVVVVDVVVALLLVADHTIFSCH